MQSLGYVAAGVSLLLIFVGFPRQILKNHRRKSCEGIDITLAISAFAAYTAWSAYGWSVGDKFLIWSQTPGALLALILLVQFYRYRKSRPNRPQ